MKKQKLQKNLGRLCMMVLFLLTFVCINGMTAQAQRYDSTISLDGNWVDGNLTNCKDAYYYKFTIPSAGTVYIEGQGLGLRDAAFVLWDKDLARNKSYWYNYVYSASITNPKTVSGSMVLEAGTYILKVCSNTEYYVGTYRLRGTFTPANNNETEPNNLFSKAQNLSENQVVTGLISMDDDEDFYSFTISGNQRVRIEFDPYYGWTYFSVWDKDFKKLNEDFCRGGDGTTPVNHQYEAILNPGTYYIKIESSNSVCKYTVKYCVVNPVFTVKLPKSKKMAVGETAALTATVLPADATDQSVTWQTNNSGVVSVSETGVLTAMSPGKATITAISNDNNKIKATCTVTVNPKKVSISKVKNIAKRGMKVTWKKQEGISGYQVQYSTNKNFKKAKSSKVSSYYNNLSVKSLKKKTYYVRVRAYKSAWKETYYGAWSKPKQIKIKK